MSFHFVRQDSPLPPSRHNKSADKAAGFDKAVRNTSWEGLGSKFTSCYLLAGSRAKRCSLQWQFTPDWIAGGGEWEQSVLCGG